MRLSLSLSLGVDFALLNNEGEIISLGYCNLDRMAFFRCHGSSVQLEFDKRRILPVNRLEPIDRIRRSAIGTKRAALLSNALRSDTGSAGDAAYGGQGSHCPGAVECDRDQGEIRSDLARIDSSR